MKNKRRVKIALGCLLVVLIAIQFVPVDRENPAVAYAFSDSSPAADIFKRSCYDCHSNETNWPWYSYVAPVSWLVAEDVHEGREHLNFSTWGELETDKQARLIEEIWEEVEGGDMPLSKYTLIHPGAKLSEEDKTAIREWSEAAASGGFAGKIPSVEEIMRRLNSKSPEALSPLIREDLNAETHDWESLQSQMEEFVVLASALGKNQPPAGGAESWANLTAAYAANARALGQAVQDQDIESARAVFDTLSKACKTCHREHRP